MNENKSVKIDLLKCNLVVAINKRAKMLRSPAHIVGPSNGAGGIMSLHHPSSPPPHARTSLFDSCHRKIRFIGSSPFALFGTLVA